MNARVLLSFLGPLLELKFLEGYRSQLLGLIYGAVVMLQGMGYADSWWDVAEMVKGGVVMLMPATMAAKITKTQRAAEDAKAAAEKSP